MVPSHLRPQAYAYAMQPAAEPAVMTIEHEPLGVAEPVAEPAVREPGE
jgi:hypothetical protein